MKKPELIVLCAFALLAACGGGGDTAPAPASTPAAPPVDPALLGAGEPRRRLALGRDLRSGDPRLRKDGRAGRVHRRARMVNNAERGSPTVMLLSLCAVGK